MWCSHAISVIDKRDGVPCAATVRQLPEQVGCDFPLVLSGAAAWCSAPRSLSAYIWRGLSLTGRHQSHVCSRRMSTPSAGVSNRDRRLALVAGAVGNGFEWYDWTIYALLAPWFAKEFFPQNIASAALLSSFAVFAVGFLARPLAGLVFGWRQRPKLAEPR